MRLNIDCEGMHRRLTGGFLRLLFLGKISKWNQVALLEKENHELRTKIQVADRQNQQLSIQMEKMTARNHELMEQLSMYQPRIPPIDSQTQPHQPHMFLSD